MSSEEIRELFEDCIHLASRVADDHFGKIADIREENQDREEVEYVKDMKILTYETLLKELVRWRLDQLALEV